MTSSEPYRLGSGVTPAVTELGKRVTYRGWIVRPGQPAQARFLAPDTTAAFTWGAPAVMRRDWVRKKKVDPAKRYDISGSDTLFVEIPLQAFALGRLTVPGVRIEIDDGRGPRVERLPVTTFDVLPVLGVADSNADFRALHGPIGAPWWERVPWRIVLAVLAALAVMVALIVAARRRRRRADVPEVAPSARDPRAEALAALAALRALHLAELGRYGEHAFRLGPILRRYLEAVTGATQPGDTTPELVAHLRQAGLESEDLTRLSGLLRAWDQVKFAREPYTLDEAVRAERATEAFLKRPVPAASGAAAGVGKVA
jgi:hypothetical protein